MVVSETLIARAGELKRQLIDFTLGQRYKRQLRAKLAAVTEDLMAPPNEMTWVQTVDTFALEDIQPDGRTVVEHFVAAHPELTAEERELLLGWREVVMGVYRVERRDGGAVILHNLIDDLDYRAHSNLGASFARQVKPGSFLIARLVPIGDEWLFSGNPSMLPADQERAVHTMASGLALQIPRLAFRNPARLAQARAALREDYDAFVAFCGSDLVVLAPDELEERMDAFHHYRTFERPTRDDNRTPAERHKAIYGQEPPPAPHFELPDDLLDAETIGAYYDPDRGLEFLPEFGRLQAIFANPGLLAERQNRQLVRNYIEESSLPPMPIERLAAVDPARTSQVFQRALNERRFDWKRDGEALLRRHKPEYYNQPALPRMAVMDGALSPAPAEPPAPPRRVPRLPWQR